MLSVRYLVYAYRARTATDYVSISVLVLYVIIAISHASYNTARRRSSGAWENFEDFVALPLNFRQPDALANTCGGVERVETRTLNAKIVVVGGGNETEARTTERHSKIYETLETSTQHTMKEEIQMIFVDEDCSGTSFTKVNSDVKYGKVDWSLECRYRSAFSSDIASHQRMSKMFCW